MCTLLCERDSEVLQSVARALRHRGVADIQIADNAAMAARLADLHPVSVAVVDFSGEHDAARLVRSLSARGAEVILYSHFQPEPGAFADMHYIFIDKSVDIETLAHVAVAQRRLAKRRPRQAPAEARAQAQTFALPPLSPVSSI